MSDPKPMSNSLYVATQKGLVRVVLILASMPDLSAFLARLEEAAAVGPVLDPTLYRRATDRLGDVRRIARLALPMQEEARRQMDRHAAEAEELVSSMIAAANGDAS